MNKNATLMSHLQNAAIAVLTVTAVLLLIQTPLVGDLAGKTPYELAQDWLAGDTSTDTTVTTDLTELALPVRVVFTNEYARYGLSAITTLDTDFELAGTFFGEALGSATTYEACSGEKLLTALHASSIYLDLEAPTPLEVLSRILGVNDAPESSLLRVTRLVLCPAENGATLYLQDANQGFFVSRTAISSATLREALASLDGNGTDFAFSLSGEFSQLSPYTLIFSEPPQRYTLSASNALTDQATFLRLAEFNPHTESGYTDSSGSTIIKEVYGTLRLEPDGSVFYQGADEGEAGSIYYVSAASTGKPTMLEAVAGAQRLAFTLLRDVSGDAELYLSEIDSSNKRFTVSFDYAVGGTPLRFSDGSHAATVTIEDQTITEFSLHCRSYTLSDSPALLLPIRQAAAIADSQYLSAELHVCYDEHGADTVSRSVVVDWYYKRPDESGRMVLHYCKFCNGVVLYASQNDPALAQRGLYDHGQYPFVFDPLFMEEDSPAGFGYIDVMKDCQTAIDQMNHAMDENVLLSARQRYVLSDTAGVNEEELADLSRDIVHVVGRLNDDSFRPLQAAGLQGSSLSYRQSRIEELKEISGNRDMTQGGTTGGVTAASAIAALQEAGSKLSRDMLKSAYRAFSRQCCLMIELMRQFYDEQRIFRIVGPSGENQFLPFSAAALRPQPVREVGGVELGSREPIFDIVVSAAKKSTFSRLSQNETAKECYQLGFFDPANADAALAALEMMDFEGIEKVRQRVRQNGTLAQKLVQLQQAVPPQTGTGGAVLPGSLPVAAAARAMNVKL